VRLKIFASWGKRGLLVGVTLADSSEQAEMLRLEEEISNNFDFAGVHRLTALSGQFMF
jgi:hypothetical protein